MFKYEGTRVVGQGATVDELLYLMNVQCKYYIVKTNNLVAFLVSEQI